MSSESTQPLPFFRLTSNDQLYELGLNYDNVKDLYDYLIGVLGDDELVPQESYISDMFTAFVKNDLYMKEKNVKTLLGYPALLMAIVKDNDGILFCEKNETAFAMAFALALEFASGLQFSALKLPGSPATARHTLTNLATQIFDVMMPWISKNQDYFDHYIDAQSHPKNIDTVVKLLTLSEICHPEFNVHLRSKISDTLSNAPLRSEYAHPEMLDCLKTIHIISGAVDAQGCPDYENLPGKDEDILDSMYNIVLVLAETDNRHQITNDVLGVIVLNNAFNYLQSGVPAHKVIEFVNATAGLINPWYRETVGDEMHLDFLNVMIANAFSAHQEYWPAIKKESLLGLPVTGLLEREPYDLAYGPLQFLGSNESAQRKFLTQLCASGVDYLDEDTTCCLGMQVDFVSSSMGTDGYLVGLRTRQMMNHAGWKKIPKFLLSNPANADFLDDETLALVVEQCVIDVNKLDPGFFRRLPILEHALSYPKQKSQPLLELISSKMQPDLYLKKLMDSLPAKAYGAFDLPDRVMSLRLEADLGL